MKIRSKICINHSFFVWQKFFYSLDWLIFPRNYLPLPFLSALPPLLRLTKFRFSALTLSSVDRWYSKDRREPRVQTYTWEFSINKENISYFYVGNITMNITHWKIVLFRALVEKTLSKLDSTHHLQGPFGFVLGTGNIPIHWGWEMNPSNWKAHKVFYSQTSSTLLTVNRSPLIMTGCFTSLIF